MPKVVGVKFSKESKVYSFDPAGIELQTGDAVIVETVKGTEFGLVAHDIREVSENSLHAPLKPVKRKATDNDIAIMKKNQELKPEALKICLEKIEKHKLDMSLVDVEYSFDGNKIVFYFTADGRVDFRELVKDLASQFRMRIELRQIGIRDECKMLGGIAPCGRQCCCSAYLNDFGHVSVKMAKNQGLSLNPTKISGLCGRLMCCLQYENAHYVQTAKKMPKLNSEVTTVDGKGVVTAVNMLKETVRVKRELKGDSFEEKEYTLDQITSKKTIIEEPEDDKADDTDILLEEKP